MNQPDGTKSNARGTLFAAIAYFIWGISPFYWHLIREVSPFEIIMHRIVWSSASLLILLCVMGRLREFLSLFRNLQALRLSLITAILIGINWGVFIYGVNTGKTLDVSLGYYICPLVTVFLASLILKEKLTRGQKISVLLAASGVLVAVFHSGFFPTISTVLAVTFAIYGLLRKQMKIDALMGLALETFILFVPAIVAIVVLHRDGTGSFTRMGSHTDLLLMLGGVVTMVPLLFYSLGVRNANLALVGFLQYIGPTLQLLSAIFIFGEPFDLVTLVSFVLIWVALGVFVKDAFRRYQSQRGEGNLHNPPIETA